jgi:uncharacterized protein DUF3472/uncharacterized protein DUF5077
MKKTTNQFTVLLICFANFSFIKGFGQNAMATIPLGGNTWSYSTTGGQAEGGHITDKGIVNWTETGTSFTNWFRVSRAGNVHVWLNLFVPDGESRISIQLGGIKKDISVSGTVVKRCEAGIWTIQDTGYQAIQISGISKTGTQFAAIESISLEGDALNGITAFTPNNEGNFYYWGRRGPSVHLSYALTRDVHAEWFYNEVTVPDGQDVEGSYFMADGFGQGYFGMQVNSPTERHILFSVWSPFHTDNPRSIPDSQKIILVRKGESVHAGEFGNEGSGGQSYLNYPWKAGNTYRFLLRAEPLEHNYTQFTAWFYAPEKGQWMLIASFKRPQTNSWLTNLHSFLENFEPEQGTHSRFVLFNHQWVKDDKGNWLSLNKARFTGDNTARKGYRMDYGGGLKSGAFYLRNCGFFNDYTPLNTPLERPMDPQTAIPAVDLIHLP